MRAVLEAVVYGHRSPHHARGPRAGGQAAARATRGHARPFRELLDELAPDELIRQADAYLGEEQAGHPPPA